MLRLYLPFRDAEGAVVRWSRHLDLEYIDASAGWFEATDGIAERQPQVRELVSCQGELDEETAAALRDAIGGLDLTCLRWVGYGETPHTPPPLRLYGEEHVEAALTRDDLTTGRRIPEFARDDGGRLAWGGRLYPDSLIVAAEPSIFRALHDDPRIDTVSARMDRDILPPSAGD